MDYTRMVSGSMFPGERYCSESRPNYHIADNGSRHYLCGCARSIRIDDEYLNPINFGIRVISRKRYQTALPKRANLWCNTHQP